MGEEREDHVEFVPLDLEGLPDTYDVEALGGQPRRSRESDKVIELSYRFPGFFRSDHERDVGGQRIRFDVLDIGGLGHVMSSGKPQLPSFGRYVQIPQGCQFEVSAESTGKTAKIEGVVVHPAQEMMTDGTAEHPFEYDASFYSKDEYYPKDLVSASGPFVLDGYPALLVHVCPLQYNPKRRLLRGHARIDVKITLEKSVKAPEPSPEPTESREAYGNLFLNPRRDVGPRVGFPPPQQPIRPMGPELLIVYAPKFAVAAHELAHWKNRKGLVTELLEFGGSVNTAAALKAEIRQRRSALRSRLRYVMLFGDGSDIPFEVSSLGNHTDYYYSTRDDCSTSVPLPTPWLALGRIPVRDTTEATSVVNQIIAYERNPPADPSYYSRFVCAGFFQTSQGHDTRDYVFTMETVRTFLTSLGYDAERVYTCDTPLRPLYYMNGQQVPADVVAAIMSSQTATQRLVDVTTEGHVVIAHRDHGDTDGWYMPPFKLGDLGQVTGDVPSMFYSVNCLTGAWQSVAECFADKSLRLPGTAPTLIASTEVSSTYLNNAMMLALFDATYGGLLPTVPGSTVSYPVRFNRIGDILNYAKSYLPLVSTSSASILSHDEKYHVVGDPSLGVWTNEPRPLHIGARLTPRALEVELNPLPSGCVVTVWLGRQMLKRLTPSSSRFAIPLPAQPLPPRPQPREVVVCACAPGFHFAETHVPIRVVSHELVGVP
jgi:hypothetical protein